MNQYEKKYLAKCSMSSSETMVISVRQCKNLDSKTVAWSSLTQAWSLVENVKGSCRYTVLMLNSQCWGLLTRIVTRVFLPCLRLPASQSNEIDCLSSSIHNLSFISRHICIRFIASVLEDMRCGNFRQSFQHDSASSVSQVLNSAPNSFFAST